MSTNENIPKNETTEEDPNIKFIIHDALQDLCTNNMEYFQSDESQYGQRLFEAFRASKEHAASLRPLIEQISNFAPDYDLDEKTPGNGYRSFLSVVDSAILHSVQLSRKVCLKRDHLLFRKGFFTREVESCSQLLASLGTCLRHLITLSQWCKPGELFADTVHSAQDLLASGDEVNQYCFYGRCLGFQFCESMRGVLKFISLCMAGFSEVYYNRGSLLSKATSSMWVSGRYLMDPEARARRIVNISQYASVDFCKAFWFLAENEIMHRVPTVVSVPVAVDKVISIPPEPMTYTKPDGTVIDIPIPDAHIGTLPVQIRLISNVVRQGMIGVRPSANQLPPSKGLLFHCHGGGFVAQSSRSHEVYLRQWAALTDVPIVSVDYSLAPAAPFPRAHQEVLYAYVWALNNAKLLGTTAERIIFAGDSAGGNLNLGVALKCEQMGLRKPDGLMLVYVPVLIHFVPSPARMLCLMDPLLPFGFMMRCLKAYTNPIIEKEETEKKTKPKTIQSLSNSDSESFEDISESDFAELQAHKSPASELSDTLTNVSLSSPHSAKQNSSFGHLTSEDEAQPPAVAATEQGAEANVDKSQKYIQELGTFVDQLECEGEQEPTLRNKITKMLDSFTKWTGSLRGPSDAEAILDIDKEIHKSLQEEFRFTVPDDPYLSPYNADDELVKNLPPIRILTVELDPCLDDCVMFAKKLKKLDNDVHLEILKGLPHGFLNFCLLSKEANEGSKLCAKYISEMLNLNKEQ